MKKEFSKNVTREIGRFTFVLLLLGIGAVKSWAQQKTVYYYDNGKISSEGFMRDGKPDGYWKTYYLDGGLKTEGNRLNFKLDSIWKFYREDSTLEKSISYREDLKNGWEKFYSTKGILLEEYTYANNLKEGLARYYYPTGELWKEVNFKNNKEEGKAFEFEKDGRIITLMTYRNGYLYAQEKINRYNSEGRKSGNWQEYYPNTRVKEEGNWTNGLRNGIFKFYKKNGDLDRVEKYEEGELVKDDAEAALLDIRKEYNEDGSVKSVGAYKDGKKHGTFREFDAKGNIVGAFIYDNETKSGEGLLDTLGRKQGLWKWFYPDGSVRSQGTYKDGKKDGEWTYFFTTGKAEQKGTYKDDVYIGNWKWFFADGRVHREEQYRKGREEGHFVEYDSLGNVLTEGDYIDGLKTGKWILHVNDHFEEGEFLDGERNGKWIWKYENDQLAFEGEFQNGVPVGKHKYWWHNGQLKMKGEYEAGEQNGRWDYLDENGVLTLYVEYDIGIAVRINGQRIKLPKQKNPEQ